jgi:hypothetical protein
VAAKPRAKFDLERIFDVCASYLRVLVEDKRRADSRQKGGLALSIYVQVLFVEADEDQCM